MTANHQPTSSPPPDSGRNSRWSRPARFVVSLLLAGHLLAVVLPPLAFQTSGPLGLSPSVEMAIVPVEQYSQFMYLDRGYAFFAPDPGPSHLIQAGLTDGSGKLTEQIYPDRQQQWPRLLYHRYFMLAEFLNDAHQPPGPPPELGKEAPEAALSWRDARARYEHLRHSMAKHLEHTHPGSTVGIQRIEHLIPGVIEFQERPTDLTDKRFYAVLLDNPQALQSEGKLIAPNRTPEAVQIPDGRSPATQPTKEQASEVIGEKSESNSKPESETGSQSRKSEADDADDTFTEETDR